MDEMNIEPSLIDLKVYETAFVYAEKHNCDVLLYNGEIDSASVESLVRECREQKGKRENVLLILVTPGGDADAAYRLARCLQEKYKRFSVFVPGWCKSAGTLIVIGAQELVMGDYGELGPLDVQLSKSDELFEWNSGLVIDSALDALETRAMAMFERYFMQIKARTRNRVTYKTATQIASSLVVDLLTPVFSQIDPIKIGENAREMSVAGDYGKRLNEHSENLFSRRSLVTLVESYSSHGFVIDKKEARNLFKNVSDAAEELAVLEILLGTVALTPGRQPWFGYLSNSPDESLENADGQEHAESPPPSTGSADAEIIKGNFGGATGEDSVAPKGKAER